MPSSTTVPAAGLLRRALRRGLVAAAVIGLAAPVAASAARPADEGSGGGTRVTSLQPWKASNLYRAGQDLDGRARPALNPVAKVNHVRKGQWIPIECQTTGESAYGSRVWIRTGGLYVPDRYVKTYASGLLAGVPRCEPPAPVPAQAGTGGSAPKGGGRCVTSPRRERQSRTVNFGVNYSSTRTVVSQAGPHVNTYEDQDKRTGTVRITAATCKDRNGWRPVAPIAVSSASYGLSADGDLRGEERFRGWAIGVIGGDGAARPTVDVQQMHCGKGIGWAAAGSALGFIPIPGNSYLVTAGKQLVGKRLPKDEIDCTDMGRQRITVGATRKGRLRVTVDGDGGAELSSSTGGGFDRDAQYLSGWRTLPPTVTRR